MARSARPHCSHVLAPSRATSGIHGLSMRETAAASNDEFFSSFGKPITYVGAASFSICDKRFLEARLMCACAYNCHVSLRRHLSEVPGLNTGRGSKPSSTSTASTASKGKAARGGSSSQPSFSSDSAQCTLPGTVEKGNLRRFLPVGSFPRANPFLFYVRATPMSSQRPFRRLQEHLVSDVLWQR